MSDETTPEQPTATPETESAPSSPARRRIQPLAAGLIGLIVGAAAASSAWALSSPSASAPSKKPTFDFAGALALTEGVPGRNDATCLGSGGYSDIAEGTVVTIYDAAGSVVGVDALGQGKPSTTSGYGRCDFQFRVQSVPEGSKFYQVEISHRGKLTVSAEDAKAGRFASSLG